MFTLLKKSKILSRKKIKKFIIKKKNYTKKKEKFNKKKIKNKIYIKNSKKKKIKKKIKKSLQKIKIKKKKLKKKKILKYKNSSLEKFSLYINDQFNNFFGLKSYFQSKILSWKESRRKKQIKIIKLFLKHLERIMNYKLLYFKHKEF